MSKTVITSNVDHSSEIFRTIFYQSPVGIEIYDPEGVLIDANAACLKIFGVESVEEVRGFRLFEDPNLPDDAKNRLLDGKAVQFEREFNFDFITKMSLYRTSKTGKCYIDCHIKPLLTDKDGLSGFLVHVIDITKRKRAEIALRDSEEKFRTIFRSAGIGITLADTERIIFDCNPAMENLLGYSRNELIGKSIADISHPEDEIKNVAISHASLAERQQNFRIEKRYIRKDGEIITGLLTVSNIFNAEGRPEFIVGMIEDITERKKSEEALALIEKRYRTFLDSTTDISFLKDENFRYVIVNKAFTAFTGRNKREIIGKTDFEFIPRSVAEACRLSDLQALESGEVAISEEVAGGRVLETRKFRVDMGNGKFGVGAFVRDITDQRLIEDAIEKSHQVLINVLDGIDAVVYVADMTTYEVLYANKYMKNIFGDITGSICWQTIQSGQTGPCVFCTNHKLLTAEGKPSAAGHWEFRNTVDKKWYDIRDRAIEWRDGRIVRLAIATDITELKEAEDALRCMSFVDDLTGLYNRRGFLSLAEQQLRMAHREKKELLLIFADLDNMKWINDSLGHPTGDKALKDTAGVLRETFRESDIIARVGGDEFVVLAIEDPDAGTESLIRRLESRIDAYNAEKRLFTLSLSLGTTRYDPESPSPLNELLNRADAMMYRQKHAKKMKG